VTGPEANARPCCPGAILRGDDATGELRCSVCAMRPGIDPPRRRSKPRRNPLVAYCEVCGERPAIFLVSEPEDVDALTCGPCAEKADTPNLRRRLDDTRANAERIRMLDKVAAIAAPGHKPGANDTASDLFDVFLVAPASAGPFLCAACCGGIVCADLLRCANCGAGKEHAL